jgi:predicted enzyme related to lactoylglutathione lyase
LNEGWVEVWPQIQCLLRFAGVELYFEDLDRAKEFYEKIFALEVADEERGQYAKFHKRGGLCLFGTEGFQIVSFA